MSAVCALLLARKGTIQFEVTGNCCFKKCPTKGRLEIPCVFTFSGEFKPCIVFHITKIHTLNIHNTLGINLYCLVKGFSFFLCCFESVRQQLLHFGILFLLNGICLIQDDKNTIMLGKEIIDKDIGMALNII